MGAALTLKEADFQKAIIDLAQRLGWRVAGFIAEPDAAEVVPAPPAPAHGLGDELVGTSICDLTIEMEPVTKARARVAGGRTYTPDKTVVAEEEIRWMLRQAGVVPDADHQVAVDAVFRSRTRQRRDLDNFLKLLLDACNGFTWQDDVQVVEIHAVKETLSASPGIDLRVRRVGRHTFDCAQCGKVLTAQQVNNRSITSRVRGVFCSRACRDTAVRTGEDVACANCGERFYRHRCKASRQACSPECGAELRKKTTAARRCRGADGKGFPDLVLVRERIIFAVVKAEKGRVRPDQKVWLDMLRAAGAQVHVWKPSDWPEIEEVLAA